jgi:hypothetical protein
MAKPFDTNPMTKLWYVVNNNALLTQRLIDYLKSVEITIVSRFDLLKMNKFKMEKPKGAYWCYHPTIHVYSIVVSWILMFLFSQSKQSWNLNHRWINDYFSMNFLIIGCVGCDFELHWAKSNIQLGSNSLQSLWFVHVWTYDCFFVLCEYVASIFFSIIIFSTFYVIR